MHNWVARIFLFFRKQKEKRNIFFSSLICLLKDEQIKIHVALGDGQMEYDKSISRARARSPALRTGPERLAILADVCFISHYLSSPFWRFCFWVWKDVCDRWQGKEKNKNKISRVYRLEMNLPISTKELVFQRLSAATLKQKESPLRKPKNNNKKKTKKNEESVNYWKRTGKRTRLNAFPPVKIKLVKCLLANFCALRRKLGGEFL